MKRNDHDQWEAVIDKEWIRSTILHEGEEEEDHVNCEGKTASDVILKCGEQDKIEVIQCRPDCDPDRIVIVPTPFVSEVFEEIS